MQTKTRRLGTAALTCAAALSVLAPAAQAAPEPCGGTYLITDPAGDQAVKAQGQTVAPAPANADGIGVFFRVDDGKVTGNLAISDLTQTVPAPFAAIRYRIYYFLEETERYLEALLTSSGVTYTYGSGVSVEGDRLSFQKDGDTTGALFEGKNGVVQIVIPGDVGGTPGTKLDTTSATVGFLTVASVPPQGQLAPFYFQGDLIPDEGDGPSTTPADCSPAAPPEAGASPQPQPQPQPQPRPGPGQRSAAGLEFDITPGRDTKPPFVFRTEGRLVPPANVRREDACQGRVTVQVKRGKRTISARREQVSSDCTFTHRVTFRNRKRLGKARALKFIVLFQGNKVLLPQKAAPRSVRVR